MRLLRVALLTFIGGIAIAGEVHHRNNAELRFIVQADQDDRNAALPDWTEIRKRDRARVDRVKEMMRSELLHTPADDRSAALVLQHGFEPSDYETAHTLALRAATRDPRDSLARWLVAATQDRYLQSIGKPQIYGTQYHRVDGVWTLQPIDENAVTDEERARWDVPELAESKRRVAAMNANP